MGSLLLKVPTLVKSLCKSYWVDKHIAPISWGQCRREHWAASCWEWYNWFRSTPDVCSNSQQVLIHTVTITKHRLLLVTERPQSTCQSPWYKHPHTSTQSKQTACHVPITHTSTHPTHTSLLATQRPLRASQQEYHSLWDRQDTELRNFITN